MIRNRGSKNYSSRSKNESVEDPHELLLSLVDMGSLDCDECLLACVSEMSDAECKRVLSSLSLPNCCDEVEEDDDLELEDDVEADDIGEDIEVKSDEDVDENDDDETEDEEDIEVELESRIRRLERNLRAESMNRNRVRRFSRRGR